MGGRGCAGWPGRGRVVGVVTLQQAGALQALVSGSRSAVHH
jgi:hypothetical protein